MPSVWRELRSGIVNLGPIEVLPHLGGIRRLPVLTSLTGGEEFPHPMGLEDGDRVELRRYVPGDSARFIHWKVFGRTRKLMVRVPERALSRARRTVAYLVAGVARRSRRCSGAGCHRRRGARHGLAVRSRWFSGRDLRSLRGPAQGDDAPPTCGRQRQRNEALPGRGRPARTRGARRVRASDDGRLARRDAFAHDATLRSRTRGHRGRRRSRPGSPAGLAPVASEAISGLGQSTVLISNESGARSVSFVARSSSSTA